MPVWLFGVAMLLAIVTLVRALLLQYLVPPDSVWSLTRIGLGFAVFALTARYVKSLARQPLSVFFTFRLVLPIGFVALARLETGGSAAGVLAAAASAFAGCFAGAAIGEKIAGGETKTVPKEE
jgi:hypothetical protein